VQVNPGRPFPEPHRHLGAQWGTGPALPMRLGAEGEVMKAHRALWEQRAHMSGGLGLCRCAGLLQNSRCRRDAVGIARSSAIAGHTSQWYDGGQWRIVRIVNLRPCLGFHSDCARPATLYRVAQERTRAHRPRVCAQIRRTLAPLLRSFADRPEMAVIVGLIR
jgi:hypothetical protein